MIAAGSLTSQNMVRGSAIRGDQSGMLENENGPGGAGNTGRGLLPSAKRPQKGGGPMLSALGDPSHADARTHLVEMLDEVRRQQELLNNNRARYLALARRYGMSDADIAAAVGMSASGVSKAIRRAAGTPGMGDA